MDIDRVSPQSKFLRHRILTAAGILLIVGLAATIVIFWERVQDLGSYGYLGAFIISILGAATIIVPVPALAVVFALGGVLPHPLLVGLAAGLGEPIGELTGYMAGAGGREVMGRNPSSLYHHFERWMQRRGALAIFAMASVPNPTFDLMGAAAGAVRYPLWKFLLACWAGKTVKGLAVAYAGAFGLRLVLRWLGLLNW